MAKKSAEKKAAAKAPAKAPAAKKPATHDEYLEQFSEEQQAALQKLRKMIHAAAKGAEEGLSYGLASFKLGGKPLVAYGATDAHCAFYLMSNSTVKDHAELLAKYDTSTGTIRFPASKPLPAALVKKLVQARIAENETKSGYKKK